MESGTVQSIGLVAPLFFGFRALLGDSWHVRLARQITERFRREGIEEAFKESSSCYWNETRTAFENALNAVERDFVGEMKKLGAIHSEPRKLEEAARFVSTYKTAKAFFRRLAMDSAAPRAEDLKQ